MSILFALAAAATSGVLLLFSYSEAEPLIGTFKLNARKSRSSKGESFVNGTIEAIDEGNGVVRMFYERIRSDGLRISLRYRYHPDCIDCPVSGGVEGLTVSRAKIGERTYKTVWKINGVIVSTSENVYSSDLKVLTNTADNIDEQGTHYKTVMVWERQ